MHHAWNKKKEMQDGDRRNYRMQRTRTKMMKEDHQLLQIEN